MSNSSVIESLENKFKINNGLPWEKRKIIIWNDYEKSYEDLIDALDIEDVIIRKLEEDNFFETKYFIEKVRPNSNILIYNTIDLNAYSNEEKSLNWIKDIEIYAEAFHSDAVSLLLNELNIYQFINYEDLKKYMKFFKENRRKNNYLKRVENIDKIDIKQFERAMMSVLSKSESIDFEEILRNTMIQSLDLHENNIYKEIVKFNLEESLWSNIDKYYGYSLKNKPKDLYKLLIHISCTSLNTYIEISDLNQYRLSEWANCRLFINNWSNHNKQSEILDEYLDTIENEINLENIIKDIPVNDYREVDLFKIFDREIIRYILESYENKILDYDDFIKLIETRKKSRYYVNYKYRYEALLYYLEMMKLQRQYSNNIKNGDANTLVDLYSNELYKFDYFYRKFYLNIDEDSMPNESMKKIKELVDDIYTNWFLSETMRVWNNSLNDVINNQWTIYSSNNKDNIWKNSKLMNQLDFYISKVSSFNSGEKVFVIISDALRYEVGKELAGILSTRMKKGNKKFLSNVDIQPMLASTPTITKIGMASLLPHKNGVEISDEINIYIDDLRTDSIESRNKILKKKKESSMALNFKEIYDLVKNCNSNEFKDLVNTHEIVYIYHNRIDDRGDKYNSENEVFNAVEETFEELTKTIELITKTYKSQTACKKIYITSDHGFLYQRSKIKEYDKISSEISNVLEKGRRYLISKENKEINNEDAVFKVDLSYLGDKNKGLYNYTLKDNVRFKLPGGGDRYVHGGISLQECIVPLIECIPNTGKSSNTAQNKFKYAHLELVDKNKKITNNISRIKFLQVEPVGNGILEAEYKIYICDGEGNVISDTDIVHANSTENEATKREKGSLLTIKSQGYSKDKTYYLKIDLIKEVNNKITFENVDSIPISINLAIVDDFEL